MGKKKSSEMLKKLPSREENVIDWLNEVLLRTEILDYRYNLKGCGVWRGYGFKIRKNVLNIIRELLDNTEIPHEEHLFPLLIPEPQFMKEAEHVKGFEDEVYWVTHGGLKPLDIKLALRPTSETVFYPMFALWIQSHTDLPIKPYQIVNTFRYEGKNTRPMLRVREITTFKEAHTAHATAEDAERQILEAVEIYKEFFNRLGLSYIINERPKWDTFPGANYTIAFDVIFPGKHRALQVGTVHNLGQTFAKTFDIKFETPSGTTDYVYQTCYGISERAIASLLVQHGDDKGLVLPAHIAPIQIAIVPILFKNANEAKILDKCRKLYKTLKEEGFRVIIDDRGLKPGSKFYYWEQKGVPVRIEIGPKDIENNSMLIVRRDTGEKQSISLNSKSKYIKALNDIFATIFDSLKLRQANETQSCIIQTDDLDDALDWVEQNKGVAEIPMCGSEECASDIEKRVDGLKFLGIPYRYMKFAKRYDSPPQFGEINWKNPDIDESFCVICSKRVDTYWTIGRSY
ncbi:MAG: proline--tRNA ligase [Promethearchaeota archaeon]